MLWLFNPFISAIYLFRSPELNSRIAPYLLLSIFFGISFVVSTTGADSQRYAQELAQYNQNNTSISEVLTGFYSQEGTKLDVYQPIVTWLVSLVTGNEKLLFGLYALIFGFFWFKSLLLIKRNLSIELKGLTLAIFLLLAFTNPIWNINGVRMWTATIIFFYGLLTLNFDNRKIGWLFLILPLFVHFSLIIGLLLYIAFRLFPAKNHTLLFAIFMLTFFYGELDLDIVRSYFEQLPGIVQTKRGYLNEEYAEGIVATQNQYSAHVLVARMLTKYCVVFLTALIFFYTTYKKETTSKLLANFFSMGLFFASFSNLATSVPSGKRFIILSNLILLTAFLIFLNSKIKIPILITRILIVSISFILIFNVREGLDFVGIFYFIGNPIVNWFVVDSPFIDFVKSIL